MWMQLYWDKCAYKPHSLFHTGTNHIGKSTFILFITLSRLLGGLYYFNYIGIVKAVQFVCKQALGSNTFTLNKGIELSNYISRFASGDLQKNREGKT